MNINNAFKPLPLLIEAINNRNLVSFQYEDTMREVEPYSCGVFNNGNTILIAYQVGGQSRSNKKPEWRNFFVKDILNLQIKEIQFKGIRSGYNPNDKRMHHVFAKVK